jgi:hypothetical protein
MTLQLSILFACFRECSPLPIMPINLTRCYDLGRGFFFVFAVSVQTSRLLFHAALG